MLTTMDILLVFTAYLVALDCLTGVKGGVCPGYNIPVIWPCSDGTITGTKLLMDTSDIPFDMLQCNCKITTTTNAVQISLLKAPDYRNCGTEIRFSTAEYVSFGCVGGGAIVNTDAIKTVDVIVEKDNTIADTRHCFYIDVTSTPTNSIANMSITCSSHRSTVAPSTKTTTALTSTVLTSPSPSTASTVISTSPSAPTAITTSPPPSTSSTVVSTSSSASTAITTSPSPSTASTVVSTSPSASTAISSTVVPSQTPLTTTQTSTGSSAIPTSSSPITNLITTDKTAITTITLTGKTSPSTQTSSTADSEQTGVTSRQTTATMTGSPAVSTDKVSEMTTTHTNQDDTTSSEGVTTETSAIFTTDTGATNIGDSTVSSKTDSESTDGSEASPNTEQSTTSYTGTTPNNSTLTDNDKEAHPERLTVVIVIATIIGIFLICVLVGAIYYQKKQKRKASLNHRTGFTNMASTVDEEKATQVDSKNHIYDNPNLIPYGHMENT